MKKILVALCFALMIFATTATAESCGDSHSTVILDDALVGHAPSLTLEFDLPVTPAKAGVGMGYYDGVFSPKFTLSAGVEGFFGTVGFYPTQEWTLEYGVGYQANITEWGGLRVDYTWLQAKNPEAVEYIQEGTEGTLGVGFWVSLF